MQRRALTDEGDARTYYLAPGDFDFLEILINPLFADKSSRRQTVVCQNCKLLDGTVTAPTLMNCCPFVVL
jgi:hypothetical protein